MRKKHTNAPVGKKRGKFFITIVLLLVVAIVTTFIVRHIYTENLKPVSTSSKSVSVEIPLGSTTKQIADILKDKELIRAAWAFQWYVNNAQVRDKLQAGTYDLRPDQSVEQIVAQLTHGAVATKLVTILPGKRIDEVKQAFIDSGYQAADVEKAFDPALYKDSPVLADKPAEVNTLEGLLFPDSYQRDNNTKPEQIVRLALNEMQKRLTPEVRSGYAKHGLTTYQGLILASIVEKEVDKSTDRPIAAQVFLKRLSIDMSLGSDASDVYGSILAGKSKDANFAVNFDSEYNTRLHTGLPPTPISTAETSAIKAVANPATTDYLYFVAGHDCTTRFSKTLEEHEAKISQFGVGCQG